jgi:hypothetical protein
MDNEIEPRIDIYFHCKKCMSGQLAVGWTKEGLQVYCENCKLNIIDIDFDGEQMGLYQGEYKPAEES